MQTLSRLNRCYPGKVDTYVLDFVNDPDEILAAFKTYFATTQLSDVTDRNIILNLRSKLDALGYYVDHEIERVVNVELNPRGTHKQLEAAITPVADRLLKRFAAAKASRAAAIADHDEAAATSDGDQLSHATTLKEKVLESTVLQQQAANNSKEQFAHSPDLTSEILSAIIDSMDVQTELSSRALNSADIRDRLKNVLLNQLNLNEQLRSRAGAA